MEGLKFDGMAGIVHIFRKMTEIYIFHIVGEIVEVVGKVVKGGGWEGTMHVVWQ